MAKAMDLAPALAPARHPRNNPGANGGAPRYQDPDRIKCTKCFRWHHKDHGCGAPAPTTTPGKPSPRDLPTRPRPRVNELDTLPEHEGVPDDNALQGSASEYSQEESF